MGYQLAHEIPNELQLFLCIIGHEAGCALQNALVQTLVYLINCLSQRRYRKMQLLLITWNGLERNQAELLQTSRQLRNGPFRNSEPTRQHRSIHPAELANRIQHMNHH